MAGLLPVPSLSIYRHYDRLKWSEMLRFVLPFNYSKPVGSPGDLFFVSKTKVEQQV